MKNAYYSWVILGLLVLAETLALRAIRVGALLPFGALAVITGVVIVIIWLISKPSRDGFKLKNVTLRKMLANAISPTWLSVAYLLAFVLHIGWTSNAVNSLFVGKDDWLQAFTSFGLSVIGLAVLIIFFPEGKVDKSDAKKAVFVSGISMIGVNYVDSDNKYTISIRALEPLVSILDLVFKEDMIKKENVSQFLILNTDAHLKNGFQRKSVMDVIDANDWENCQVDTHGIEGHSGVIPLQWRPVSDDKKVAAESLIKWLIRLTAKLKYPGNDDFIDGLVVNFMEEPCDYDQFDQCFEVVKKAVEGVDNHENLLYFNLTPGTGIIGSLMTLFAIDDNRRLFYYPQNSENKMITEADKGKVPLENLISQALDSINNQ